MFVQFAELPVLNQDRAKAFYMKNFDMSARADMPIHADGWRWIELVPPGAHTSIHFVRQAAHTHSEFPVLSLIEVHIDQAYQRLVAAGVEIMTAPAPAFWNPTQRAMELRDSEGNRIILSTPDASMALGHKPNVRTCLWVQDDVEEMAKLYTSLIERSELLGVLHVDPDAPALAADICLDGTPYTLLRGGPQHKLSPAASIVVETLDQAQTDHLWHTLIEGGGQEGSCGWLVDRFGVSWQINPKALLRRISDPDREAAGRALQAMMQMKKIDIALIEAAFEGAIASITA